MKDERLQKWRSKMTVSSMNCPPADSWFTPELLYYTNFMNYRQYDSDHPRFFSLTGLKLPKTHQTPDRKVFFIWFCCFIPKNKGRKFQSTEANHNIWHSINCYASLFYLLKTHLRSRCVTVVSVNWMECLGIFPDPSFNIIRLLSLSLYE